MMFKPRMVALSAVLAIGTACVTQAAEPSYFFRSKGAVSSPVDREPDSVTFVDRTEVAPGTAILSNIVPLTGHTGVTVSVSGEPTAQFRICRDAQCADATAWGNAPASVGSPAGGLASWVQLRLTTGAAGTAAKAAELAAGTLTARWSVRPWTVQTTTAQLPPGWSSEYVPSASQAANEGLIVGEISFARLRDNDLSTPAWVYSKDIASLTMGSHLFAGNVTAERCFFVWRNDTANTANVLLRFTGGDLPVTSYPGLNTYNGSCGTVRALNAVGMTMLNLGASSVAVVEFKVGR